MFQNPLYLDHSKVAMPAMKAQIVLSGALVATLTPFMTLWWIMPLVFVVWHIGLIWVRHPLAWSKDWMVLSNGPLPQVLCLLSTGIIGYVWALLLDKIVLQEFNSPLIAVLLSVGLFVAGGAGVLLLLAGTEVMSDWRNQRVTQSENGGYFFVGGESDLVLDEDKLHYCVQLSNRGQALSKLSVAGCFVFGVCVAWQIYSGALNPGYLGSVWGKLELPLIWGGIWAAAAAFLTSTQSLMISEIVSQLRIAQMVNMTKRAADR